MKDSFEEPRWGPFIKKGPRGRKAWRVRDSARNRYILEHVLPRSPQFKRYYTPIPETVEIHPRWLPKLWSHQVIAVRFLIFRRRVIYAGDMGVGKMLATFVALDSLFMKYPGAIWWISESAPLDEYKTQRIRWQPFFDPAIVGTYDSLHQYVKRATIPPRFLVLDESTALKNIKSLRTQSALGLVECMEKHWGDDCFVFLFTGTPFPKDDRDWYAQCEVARPGFIREGSIYKFTERYFETKIDEIDGRKFPKITGRKLEEIDELPKRLAGLVLRHQRGLDTPDIKVGDKKYDKIVVPLDPSTEMVYKAFLEGEGTALQILSKCRQLADGFQYGYNFIEGKRVLIASHRVPCPKDNAVRTLLEKYKSFNRTIFYAAYREAVDRVIDVCSEYGWAVIALDGRGWRSIGGIPANIDTFQDYRKYDTPIAFVGNPRKGGKGMTLTASPMIAFYSNGFRAEDRWQAEDRIMRDSARGTDIWDIIHLPTDELVLGNLLKKRDAQEIGLEILRKYAR